MIVIVWSLSVLVAVMSALPLVRRDAWWIRACEFPRLQVLGLALVAIALALVAGGVEAGLGPAMLLSGLAALAQSARILPFTRLWPRRMSLPAAGEGPSIGLLVVNVLMTNRECDGLLEYLREVDPDLVLVVEGDSWWHQALSGLEEGYPHRVEHPRDDTYGMLLYSRLPLSSVEVRFLVDDGVPSIRCRVALPGTGETTLHALHPKPPAPQEATETTRRDAELLLVARQVAAVPGPAIVAGDLNDVAWSYTTRLFGRLSGLLDPRVGRGIFATFPAARPWLRFPLDHVFHSPDFKLAELRVGPPFGSDHLPIFARLRYDERAPEEQEPDAPQPGDHELAREKIERGLES